jgi:hypothetical protein
MSKFVCRCSHVLCTSGPIPNPVEWRTISDIDFDRFEGSVDAEEVYRSTETMIRCPVCDRLWVFWNGLDNGPTCYRPEAAD